jgi:p-aminobenzoyl-glutamate transporter AbgT
MAAKTRPARRHSFVWLQGLGCGAVVALMPAMAALLGVLLLPSLLAVLYDRQGGHPVARTVFLAGAAAAVSPGFALWSAGNTMEAALALLGDLRVVGIAWSLAAGGWILAELAPVVALVVLEAFTRTRAMQLRAERERLVAEWGFEAADD